MTIPALLLTAWALTSGLALTWLVRKVRAT